MTKGGSNRGADVSQNVCKKSINVPKETETTMGTESNIITVLEPPIKSESDKKSYRVIRLKNGLTALLISDPNTKEEEEEESDEDEPRVEDEEEKCSECESEAEDDGEESETENAEKPKPPRYEKMSACALCVGVGSYSDPRHIQGMAHFVEHMVFMGSKKYPVENDFDAFVKTKGGADNAQTDCETTTFYFEVQENYLEEGMDRFAQFFVAPLMKQEAMQREREAIESEFALATPSDSNRKEQLLCSMLPKGHPGRTFMWGNNRSLTPPVGPEDEQLYKAAHEFQRRHYSAHRMTVAVQARFPLELLEKYVVNTFGDIPTNRLPPDDFSQYKFSPDIITSDFNAFYYVKPMMQTTNLTLTWCMKSFFKDYKSKPQHYVSWIIGHEGTGSLLLYLQRRVWALEVTSGLAEGGVEHTSLMGLFSLSITLTQKGLDNVHDVLDCIFSYINMLKRDCPNERIFKEIRDVEDINFRFCDEPQPCDNVEQLSENMQYLPSEHYIVGQDIYFEYDPDGIMYVINSMSPETVNIMLLSQNYSEPIHYDSVEEWFGTEYKKTKISPETVARWKSSVPHKEFHLPETNRFIPDNFDLIPLPVLTEKNPLIDEQLQNDILKKTLSNPNIYPKLIRNDKLMEVWFKSDYKFDLPYSFVYLYFITPLAKESAKSACLMDIWCTALAQLLTEKLYAADVTGLSRSLYIEEKGLMLRLQGFSQKLPIVVDEITQMLANYNNYLSEELFNAIKDVHSKSYNNTIMKPTKLIKEVRLTMLIDTYRPSLDKLNALKTISFDDMKSFGDRFISKLYMKMLMQGNLLKDDALGIANTVENNLKWKGINDTDKPKLTIHKIPLGEKHCRVSSFNTADINSVITNYYQFGVCDMKNNCIVELMMLMMEEPLFDTLRTKEQLGYSVFCVLRYTNGILGFSITVNVQADKYCTGYVDARIEEFLKEFYLKIKKSPDEMFQQAKSTLIKSKSCVDCELKDEVRRNWYQITCSEYEFGKREMEIECVKVLRAKDIIDWLETYAIPGENKRRKLSVQVVGHKPIKDDDTEHVCKRVKITEQPNGDCKLKYLDINDYPEDCIKDINEFKNILDKYPPKEDTFPYKMTES